MLCLNVLGSAHVLSCAFAGVERMSLHAGTAACTLHAACTYCLRDSSRGVQDWLF